jgi:hypothetical protein
MISRRFGIEGGVTVIICDYCHAEIELSDDRVIPDEARRSGWTYSASDDKDMCLKCRNEKYSH